MRKSCKVFVGLSGGVDSSVAAALLKEQGHDVTGVFMKNWTRDIGGVICPWRQDLSDAKRVAVQLGIPFKVFDFQKEYKQKVVDYMLSEYQAGRTPNPDIMCNQEVKFKLFLQTALAEGAEAIATGHYARVIRQTANIELKTRYELHTALDTNKDQSYFLYRVRESALSKTLTPIGDLTKPYVRAYAKRLGLVTASKPDSQGICFVGEVGIADFIREFIDVTPGPVIDKVSGQEVGRHDGAILYTIGQRHGLGVGGGLPYYVTKTDVRKNIVFVTTKLDNEDLWRSEIELSDPHWINDEPQWGKDYQARVRYRAKLVSCRLEKLENKVKIKMAKAERAITPGQSVVIYNGNRVMGGGIII